MKLFHAPTSPYARKVVVVAMAAGLDGQVKLVATNPHISPPDLLTANPLSRIPCLVTEDGLALFDSPVICEYLDNIGGGNLFPPPGAPRWRALKQQAVGDGIMDAAVARRLEQGRPQEEARTAVMDRHAQAVTRALDVLEAEIPANHMDIGTIAIACALGYLDLRFPTDDWRATRPKLTAWYEKMAARTEMQQTAPPT